MDFRINKKKKNEKSLWEQTGRKTESEGYSQEQSAPVEQNKYSFSKLRERIFGSENAAEVATEQAKKLKKRMGR
jgi:hypothetical protein